MNQAEYLGARMVMLQRRLKDQQDEVKRTEDQIDALWGEIFAAPSDEVYANTGDIPKIVPDRMAMQGPDLVRAYVDTPDSTVRLPKIDFGCRHCSRTEAHVHMDDGSIRWARPVDK